MCSSDLDRRGADGDSVEGLSTGSSASVTECHSRELVFQSLAFGRVRGFSKALHERKEMFPFGFFRLKAGLDQIDEYAIGACLPRLGQSAHTLGDTCRNRHALTNRPSCFSHVATLHHCTPRCTSPTLEARLYVGPRMSSGQPASVYPNAPFPIKLPPSVSRGSAP